MQQPVRKVLTGQPKRTPKSTILCGRLDDMVADGAHETLIYRIATAIIDVVAVDMHVRRGCANVPHALPAIPVQLGHLASTASVRHHHDRLVLGTLLIVRSQLQLFCE